jgi:hypothetical protein
MTSLINLLFNLRIIILYIQSGEIFSFTEAMN